MFYIIKFFVGGVLMLCSIQAYAIPVQFKHTSIVDNSEITGVTPGDTVTITLLADNGGKSLSSQSWSIADIISGSLQAGNYWQSYVDNWFGSSSSITFATDGLGQLTRSNFSGTVLSDNHQDIFGSGPSVFLFNNGFQDFFGNRSFQDKFLINLSSWTVTETVEVPEPSTVALLCLGLMGLGWARYKTKE